MKRFCILLLVLCLFVGIAAAEGGILPVLATPVPQDIAVVSIHALLRQSTPTAEALSHGMFKYPYSKITYEQWQLYGKALAQEGWRLGTVKPDDVGGFTMEVLRGSASAKVYYNPHTLKAEVTYPSYVKPIDYDETAACEVEKDQTSVFPELEMAASLHSATGRDYSSCDLTSYGYMYSYSNVKYSCYVAFSNRLAEEGYSLTSSEILDDGTVQAEVAKGDLSLTIEYNMDNERAYITYPIGCYPRSRRMYEDYTEIKTDEKVQRIDGLLVTPLGWEKVDSYKTYYYSNNWIPAKYYDTEYLSENGIQRVLVHFLVEYDRPSEYRKISLLGSPDLYYDGVNIHYDYGFGKRLSMCEDADYYVSGKDEISFLIGMGLTEEQIAHLEKLALTLKTDDSSVCYVYYPDFVDPARFEEQ